MAAGLCGDPRPRRARRAWLAVLDRAARLRRYRGAALYSQMVLLAILSGLVLWNRGRMGGRSGLRRGLGAAVLAALAVGLTGALSAGLVYQTGQLLGGYRRTVGHRCRTAGRSWPSSCTRSRGAAVRSADHAVAATPVPRGGGDHQSRLPAVPPEIAGRLKSATKAVARARFTEWLGLLAATYAALAVIGLSTSLLG
ncbi:hypothetical protein NKG94_20485 [Micromonospora sp. M12]